ncbi:MAG: hypothetical protein IT370_28460 [Deltaproteobacteria bacterium]|nr:hypothetical protein [Deltaproteobacteria bacterium]
MLKRLCVVVTLLGLGSAQAAPPPELVEGEAVVTAWLDSQRAGKAADYLALYFKNALHEVQPVGGETVALEYAKWKAERLAALAHGTVLESTQQYFSIAKMGVAATIHVRERRASGVEDRIHILILHHKKDGQGPLMIAVDSIIVLGTLEEGLLTGGASTSVTEGFPDGFSELVMGDGGRCDKQDLCPASLELDGKKKVPLGYFLNNPEGEDTGEYAMALRGYRMAARGPLPETVLVVVENHPNADRGKVIMRRATLVGPAPKYPVLWTDDLVTWSDASTRKYKVNGRDRVTQAINEGFNQEPSRCSVAVLVADKDTALAYRCGATVKLRPWDGKRFK